MPVCPLKMSSKVDGKSLDWAAQVLHPVGFCLCFFTAHLDIMLSPVYLSPIRLVSDAILVRKSAEWPTTPNTAIPRKLHHR